MSVVLLYINVDQLSRSTFPLSLRFIHFLLCTFRKKFRRPILASLCLSVSPQVSQRLSMSRISHYSFPELVRKFSYFYWTCILITTFSTRVFYCILCRISPFHKLIYNLLRFLWVLILPSVSVSSKRYLSFALNLLKSICIFVLHPIYVLHLVFHKPR